MSPDQGRQLVLVTFLVAIAIVTWSEISDYHTIPRPQRYVGAGVVYGILSVVGPVVSYPLAGMFGVGLLLTLIYRHYVTDKRGKAVDPSVRTPDPGHAGD